jgi:hypothetical protein
MSLLDSYLIEVNTYPRFKKSRSRKLLNNVIFQVMFISFSLMMVKIVAEFLVERYLLK